MIKIRTQTQNKYKRLNKRFEKQYLAAENWCRVCHTAPSETELPEKRLIFIKMMTNPKTQQCYNPAKHLLFPSYFRYLLLTNGEPSQETKQAESQPDSIVTFQLGTFPALSLCMVTNRQCQQWGVQGRAELLLQTKQVNPG